MKRTIRQLSNALLSTRAVCQSIAMGVTFSCLLFTPTIEAANVDLAPEPLFLVKGAEPLMMLTMSKDHQLFFKAFDDYSDLDNNTATVNDYAQVLAENEDYTTTAGNAEIDTTYKNNIIYYGYFDSYKCYDYSTAEGHFVPAEYTTNRYCEGSLADKWSGNFLNWATMTRIDVTRKILYGGLRSTEDATKTVLERANLPADAHSFVKYYNGTDLGKLTPYGSAQGTALSETAGISICNSTPATSNYSHNTTDAPVIRIAKGAWINWAAQESSVTQCAWVTSTSAKVNDPTVTATYDPAAQTYWVGSPKTSDGIDYSATTTTATSAKIVRVEVCKPSLVDPLTASAAKILLAKQSPALDNQENCKAYTGVSRPIGLLHTYGENNRMYFGLMTGSYTKNISGGVLRKNIDSFQDEVDQTTGKFKTLTATGDGSGIVKTIDALRIFGYEYSAKNYAGLDGCIVASDNPQWLDPISKAPFTNKCTSWGNPQAEIFLEALRYMANKGSPSSGFDTDDSTKFPALKPVTWKDPMTKGQYCSALSVLQFNASTVSWDGDELSGTSDLPGLTSLDTLTNTIGTAELPVTVPATTYFIGLNGTDNNKVCSAKTISNLSEAKGLCPEEPRLEGSYQLAGLAWYANITDIRTQTVDTNGVGIAGDKGAGKQTVKTYGVALSPAAPKIEVTVGNKSATILPACYNTTNNTTTAKPEGNCGLAEFRQIKSTASTDGKLKSGKYLILWETNDKGADYDRDIQGTLEYIADADAGTIEIKTYIDNAGTSARMLFGYVISGTTKDGFHAHSSNNGTRGDSRYPGLTALINTVTLDPTDVVTCNGTTPGCNVLQVESKWTYIFSGTNTAALLKPPLFYAAKWGGFKDSPPVENITNVTDVPDLQEEWDADKDDTPDNYFFANDPAKLNASLEEAFKKVLDTKNSSASAVATNATRLETNTIIYQAKFNPVDWSGELLAYTILDKDQSITTGGKTTSYRKGDVNPTALWTTNAAGKIPAATDRNIFTWDSTEVSGVAVGGINFDWTSMTGNQKTLLEFDTPNNITTPAQKAAFAELRLNWLRGDDTSEGSASLNLRDRPTGIVLGDIVNSDPIFVGADDYGLEPLEELSGTKDKERLSTQTYKEFVDAKAGNTKLLLVGSNDGMLHGFNATTGVEKFAYIPNNSISKLYKLTQQDYAHEYFVDGTSIVSDAFITDRNGANQKWRTVMLGSTGAGGNTIFAIDITDPDAVDATKVLWEYAPTTLGATVGQPRIGRLANGQWAAIFSSGYPQALSTGTTDRLIIVDLATGTVIKEISTGVNSGGLATPTLIPNANRIIEYVYAGDMQGNLWKFDITDKNFRPDSDTLPNSGVWKVAYGTASVPAPLFKATDGSGNPQPITAPLEVGINPSGGLMIYFGTGQYFAAGDNIVQSNPQTQSFYAINDKGVVVTKSGLVQQSVLTDNGTNRTLSAYPVTYTGSTSYQGWYINLVTSSTNLDLAIGERVVSTAVLRFGRIIFVTVIPSEDACAGGGISWLMEMNALNGNQLTVPAYDTNKDGVIDASDIIVAGMKIDGGITKNPGIVGSEPGEMKYFSTTSGAITKVDESNDATKYTGRQSWRQMK